MNLPKPRAILFDLDNTLVHRPRSLARYLERFREAFAPALDTLSAADLAGMIEEADGGGYRSRSEMCQTLVARLPWRSPPTWMDLETHWRKWFPTCAVATDDWLEDLLNDLRGRGIRLGLVTNGSVAAQSRKIDALGVGSCFDDVVISEDVGLQKPDPAIFFFALERLAVPASTAWFVGDHPENDVLGAEGAGLTAIWLRGSHPWPSNHAEPRVALNTLREILRLVDDAMA